MPSAGEINQRTGGVGRAPGTGSGNNTEILFNYQGIVGSNGNYTINLTSQLASFNGNVRIANASNLLFGGLVGNTAANSHFAVTYNVSAQSLDFIWLG